MYKIIIVALITILLSACSQWVSVNPLSPPAEPDKKMEGLWKLESKENDTVYLHIGEKADNTMIALSIEHKVDGSLDIVEIPFFISRTGTNNYLNVRYEDIEKGVSESDKGFIFVKYSFSDDNTLFFYQFDPELIISAVQSGKLKGEVYYRETKTTPTPESTVREKSTPEKTVDSVKMTDTSENLVKYFESEGVKFLPEVLKFIRVKQ
jgi:hypothetical protein